MVKNDSIQLLPKRTFHFFSISPSMGVGLTTTKSHIFTFKKTISQNQNDKYTNISL